MHDRQPHESGGPGLAQNLGALDSRLRGVTRLADSSRQREPRYPLTLQNTPLSRGSRRSFTSTPGAAASGQTRSPKSAA